METKTNLKKIGAALAAVAASAFAASTLSGCATEMAAQNSTAATTQMQHSCKGMVEATPASSVAPSHTREHHPRTHHRAHKGQHPAQLGDGETRHGKLYHHKSAVKPKGSKCQGVTPE